MKAYGSVLLIVLVLQVFIIWFLWNWTIVSMGGPAIDGWQALGLSIIVDVLTFKAPDDKS